MCAPALWIVKRTLFMISLQPPLFLVASLWASLSCTAHSQLEAGQSPAAPELQEGQTKPVVDTAAAQKRVRDLGGGEYELGGILFNAKTRSIRLPCVLNMRQGPIEFLLVHESGKTHESMLRTAVSALDLQVVFLLLNYQPGHDGLFDSLEKTEPAAYKNLAVTKTEKPGANRVKLSLEWKTAQGPKVVPVAETLLKTPTKKAPTDCELWIFHGSQVQESGFSAALHGNLISLYYDRTGMLATPSLDNRTDDCWEPNTAALPVEETGKDGAVVDTVVTLIVTPGE
jgi:hypothetical protein